MNNDNEMIFAKTSDGEMLPVGKRVKRDVNKPPLCPLCGKRMEQHFPPPWVDAKNEKFWGCQGCGITVNIEDPLIDVWEGASDVRCIQCGGRMGIFVRSLFIDPMVDPMGVGSRFRCQSCGGYIEETPDIMPAPPTAVEEEYEV